MEEQQYKLLDGKAVSAQMKQEMTPKQYRNIKTKDVHDASEEGGGTMNV